MIIPAFKPKIIINIFFLVMPLMGIGQQDPTLPINDIYKKSREYRLQGALDHAVVILEEGINQISKNPDYDTLEVKLKLELGEVLLRKSFHYKQVDAKASKLFKEAFTIAEELQNDKLIGDAVYCLGYYDFKLGTDAWDSALVKLNRSLEFREKANDDFGLARSHFSIGVIHQRSGRSDIADEHFELSLDYSILSGSVYMQGENQRHIGYQYYIRGEFERAIPHFLASLEFRQSIGYIDGAIFAAVTVGQNYVKLKNYKAAIPYLKQGLADAERINSLVGMQRASWSLAGVYQVMGLKNLASQMASKTAAVSRLLGDESMENKANNLIGEVEDN